MSDIENGKELETETGLVDKTKKRMKRWAIMGGVVVIAFLLGFIPMWLSARNCASEHEQTRTQLRKAEVRDLLTTAVVEARRGEYEPARQSASEFFTRLRTEDEKGNEGFLTAAQRSTIAPIFDNRDPLITMLAQRDQASLDRLTDIYAIFSDAVPATRPPTAEMPAR